MKKIILILILNLIFIQSYAQCNGRYQSEIFNDVNIITINYSDIYQDNEHEMDIYTPIGDTVTNRPVIIYLHGGTYTAGDKTLTDCVDFCKSFAKRGYVTASINYRLTTLGNFLSSTDEQIKAVLRSVADSKAAVRFFRKDAANGNSYGIDPSAIFVGGYSAGAVTAIHQAFIDDMSDLPSNIQALTSVIGGTIEGDAGNVGYPSNVQGVISIAGGIMDTNWIDSFDEPIVSAHGTNDGTISYNCDHATGLPIVLILCGSGKIHTRADNFGVQNDVLIFNGEDHSWPQNGNSNTKFVQSLDFFADFLYPLLPCNTVTTITEDDGRKKKEIIKIIDVLGRELESPKKNTPIFYIYEDGAVKKHVFTE